MRVCFIRDGSAGSAPGQNDLMRPLDFLGQSEARERHDALRLKFDLVFSSPALRAMETATRVTGLELGEIVPMRALYLGPNSTDRRVIEIERLRRLLGGCELIKYVNEEGGDAVIERGREVWEMLYPELRTLLPEGNAAIVGHAPLLQSLGVAACEGDDDLIAPLLRSKLGGCEGFILNYDEGRPGWIEMINDD